MARVVCKFLGFKWKYHKEFWINDQWIKKLWWVFPTKVTRTEFKNFVTKQQLAKN